AKAASSPLLYGAQERTPRRTSGLLQRSRRSSNSAPASLFFPPHNQHFPALRLQRHFCSPSRVRSLDVAAKFARIGRQDKITTFDLGQFSSRFWHSKSRNNR